MAAALRPSRRLRRKLKPAAWAYGDCCAQLFDTDNPAEAFVGFQVVGYHTTLLLDDLMGAALERCRRLDDPVVARLHPYLERHLIEEAHHAEAGGMTLEDLATIGVDPERIRTSPTPGPVAELRSLLTDWINWLHPVAVIGYLWLEHYHATLEGIDRMQTATGLPRSVFRNLELHAHLDVGHAAEIDRLVDTLPLERHHRKLVYRSALESIKAARASLLDVFEQEDQWL